LRKREIKITPDLSKELSDGTVLIALTEALTGKHFGGKIHPHPDKEILKIENVAMAVEFMKPYTALDINPKDIVDGQLKIILGLIWRLILNFQVMETQEDSGKGTAAERNREAKKKLIEWARAKTEGYKGVQIDDVDKSFQDGLAFCALVNKYNPKLLDYDALDPKNVKHNIELALRIAEEEMGIPMLIDPEDLANPDPTARPDEQCIMTYLSEFPRAFLAKIEEEVGEVGEAKNSYIQPPEPVVIPVENEDHKRAEEELRLKDEELKRKDEEFRRRDEEYKLKEEELRRAQAEKADLAEKEILADKERKAKLQKEQEELDKIRRENEELRSRLNQLKNKLIGKLKVTIVEARGLRVSETLGVRPDPYCTATLERQREKTKAAKKTQSPKWDAEYTFYVSDPNAELDITVWDYERFTKDNVLGCVIIQPHTLTDKEEVTKWYPLQPKKADKKVTGEILIKTVLAKE